MFGQASLQTILERVEDAAVPRLPILGWYHRPKKFPDGLPITYSYFEYLSNRHPDIVYLPHFRRFTSGLILLPLLP